MTTTVTVEVHCPEDIEVQVTIDEGNVWTGFTAGEAIIGKG